MKTSEGIAESDDPLESRAMAEAAGFRRRGCWWLLAILVVAGLLRFWAIDHGLPYSYYPDETHFVKRSVAFGSGDMNPHWFHKPAFFMYVLFFEYGFYFIVGKLAGWWDGTKDFAYHYFNDPAMFYLLGRITATLAGLGVVVFSFLSARRIAGSSCGVLAAAVVGANFCLAEAGRWVKADIPCTFFTIAAVYFLIRVMQEGRWRDYWYAGIAIGIGMATKYYALGLIPSLWLVHWLRPVVGRKRHWVLDRGPLGAMAFFVVAFFVCSPYNLLDEKWLSENVFPRIRSILDEKFGIASVALGISAPGWVDGTMNLLRCLFKPDCIGWIWGPLGVLGMFGALFGRDRSAWVPLLFVLPFGVMAVIWNPIDFEPRYLSAIVPILSIAGVVVVMAGWRAACSRIALPRWLGITLFLVSIAPGVVMIINWNQRFGRPDTRTLATRWIEAHVAGGTRILNDNDHVKLRKNVASLKLEWTIIDRYRQRGGRGAFVTAAKDLEYQYAIEATPIAEREGRKTYRIDTIHHPWWPQGIDSDDMGSPFPRRPLTRLEIVQLGTRYIVTTAKTYDDYKPGQRFGDKTEWVGFYRWLKELPLVYEVPYQPEVRSGPTVRVYRVPEGYLWALRSSGAVK